jgi:HEAT repeat protein
MHPISAMGGLPLDDKRLEKMHYRPNLSAGLIHQPTSAPASAIAHQPLTANQAHAVRLLTFTGKNNKTAQGVKLENEFINTLKRTKDPTEKASVADILGRAQSINAMPHLLKLLADKHPIAIRTSAAQALGNIGASTQKDGFTAPELSKVLLETYQKRKEHLQADIESPEQFTYEQKLKRHEDHEIKFKEIRALVNGVSQLNVVRGHKGLLLEFRNMLNESQMKEAEVQELISFREVAEEAFHKDLVNRYKRPLDEILEDIPPEELEQMQDEVKVVTEDGKQMSLLEMEQEIDRIQEQHEQFDLKLLSSLMGALGQHDDNEVNAAFKQGLQSNAPGIKSHALETLADRNVLNYSSDIHPNLGARDSEVRQAALQGLVHSPDHAATQKTMELMNPQAFFQMAGGVNQENLEQYVHFLGQIAERGDNFIHVLSNRVTNPNYTVESRQIGLQVLGMMATAPIGALLTPHTVAQSRAILKVMALTGSGKNPAEQNAIATTAATLWVHTKDPSAIPVAIQLADGNERKSSGHDQERLLSAVIAVLTDDDNARTRAAQQGEVQNQLVDIMKASNSNLLNGIPEADLRAHLQHKTVQDRILENAAEGPEEGLVNKGLKDHLKPGMKQLRPILTSLAESDKSQLAQIMSMRILGLLQDEDSVKYLCDRAKNPLKDQIDWKALHSYKGDPRIDGAKIRINAIKALGDIGDARALDVMTSALEDPTLRTYVSEPLGKIAEAVNKQAHLGKLAKVRRKLTALIESPDTSRAMRSTRIKAANALFKFDGGPDALKEIAAKTHNPNFKRHVLSALISNNHGLEPEHPDYNLLKAMIMPDLGVSRLHARGITGKGVEMAIVDGGFVDDSNKEAFQGRVKLPAKYANDPESTHPTMVMSTAAANGKLKGVAPDATVYSDRWPAFDSEDPMDTYKKIIQGKLRGENNVRVINNSWGFSNAKAILSKDVRTILKEFKNVVDMAEKAGIQIVFAAGNEGEEPGFPELGTVSVFGLDVDKLTDDQKAQHDYLMNKVITVGAVNTQGSDKRTEHRMADFSSMGDSLRRKLSPTVIAPGADMMVYGWDKVKGNPKELVNGTSFASPYVSGLIALMIQANPNLEPADIREILKRSSVRLGGVPLTQQGHGEVCPEAAVKMAENFDKENFDKTANQPGGGGTPGARENLSATDPDGDVVMADSPANASLQSAMSAKSRGVKRNYGMKNPYPVAMQTFGSGPTAPGRLLNVPPMIKKHGGLSVSRYGFATPSSLSKPAFSLRSARPLPIKPPQAPVFNMIR